MKTSLLQVISTLSPYSDAIARRYVVLSAIAYAPSDQIWNWTFPNVNCSVSDFDLVGVYNDSKASSNGFLGVDHKHSSIIASFQGTADLTNWITDLSTWIRYNYECVIERQIQL
mmetsp:Transcript_5191/g.7798  ORF Transcript_5191/g.7798 Transcript_5191/m.7798 type:complete len:114 (+) Transcript_5191:16-357(+)